MPGFSIKIIALYSPIFISLIWGITLFFKNYKSQNPGYYMSFVQFSAFLIFVGITPFYHNNVLLSIQLEPFYFAGLLSIFPFVYFYVRFITTKQRIKPAFIYKHLIPPFVFFLNSVMMQLALLKNEQLTYALRQDFIADEHKWLYFFTQTEMLVKVVLIIQSIIYLYKSSRLIRDYRNNVKAYFSNIKGKYFNWINIFYITFGLSLLAAIPPLLMGNSYLSQEDNHMLTVSFFTLSFVFYSIAYIADNHSYIEDEDFYILNNSDQPLASKKMYNKLAKELEVYFIESKPYLNKELKITEVAAVLGTNRTYVSDSIRLTYHSNFNKYVNSFRVQEAVIMFKQSASDNLSTMEISELVGFHTYNSFVKAFKEKHTYTPAVFRKNVDS